MKLLSGHKRGIATTWTDAKKMKKTADVRGNGKMFAKPMPAAPGCEKCSDNSHVLIEGKCSRCKQEERNAAFDEIAARLRAKARGE